MDWIMTKDEAAWKELFEMLDHIDSLILGCKMYPVYERYWMSVLANPNDPLPENGSLASMDQIAYAAFADKTPHFSLSKPWIGSHGRIQKSSVNWMKSEI
jgi:hypothetical protein